MAQDRGLIPIADLPRHLGEDDAIEAVYGGDLDWIATKLRQRLSVLVECDKQIGIGLYRALRSRLRTADPPLRCLLLAGHAGADEEGPPQTLMQRLLTQLQEAVFGGDSDRVLVLPHLDILTTTTRSGLSGETREAAALLYENPDQVFLAFRDPSFELPKVIENLFPVRQGLIGIPRDRLPHLITQDEARKFAVDAFNPYQFYKYVSGLNALRCRQVLRHLRGRIDFDPANPESAEDLLREIRRMTVIGDMEMPQVDLDREIGGYKPVKERLRREILDLLAAKETATSEQEVAQIEEIVPKGMIFHGPPGTGKTFFAKAVATALDATISIVSGPELKSRWVGESEENLRRVFARARKCAPSVIVFDELDSFASARGTYTGSGVEHSMVNQLLTEMDGFRKEELVFVVGTTNFLDAIDPALLRPGRFELSIEIPYPHTQDRREILEIYRDKFRLEIDDELLDELVRWTAGSVPGGSGRFTGDHLYALMRALRREQIRSGASGPVTREQIAAARQRGSVRRPDLRRNEEHTIAVHEAGHAICAYVLPHCPTIKEVTISTGEEDMLGYVEQDMRANKYVTTRRDLLDDICVMLAGRAAEELLLGDISAGAYSDLLRASHLARTMVTELGMSEELGLRSLAGGPEPPPASEMLHARIDTEIEALLKAQQARALETISQYREQLEALVATLMQHKKLGLPELREIFGGQTFKQKADANG